MLAWPRRRPRWPLPPAALLSLLAHGLLLSLSFGQGQGLPGLDFPWQTRRVEAPELRVVLASPPPGQATLPTPELPQDTPPVVAIAPAGSTDEPAAIGALAEAAPGAGNAAAVPEVPEVPEVRLLAAPAADATVQAPPARAVLTTLRPVAAWALPAASAVPAAAVAVMAGASSPAVQALQRERLQSRSDAVSDLGALQPPAPAAVVAALTAASGPAVERVKRSGDALRLLGERAGPTLPGERPEGIALPSAVVSTLGLTAGSSVQALRRGSEALRAGGVAADRGAELAQLDAARLQAQQGAQQLEAARQEALRQEAQRLEAARAEALRLAAERVEAARQAAARAELARQQAVQAEAARLAAAQAEAARQVAERGEAARQQAALLAAAQAQARADEEQREARKRAIGRQLDEEAARRDAQRDSERQRPDWVPARRGRLFGRIDSHAELALYGEAWARKIENNTSPDTVRELARQPHSAAVVTVAVRSDGSVEAVTFVRSSGVPAVDEAITRIVRSQANYPAFPPRLLRDYDVVEIRRSWQFDTAVRLH
ncbi:TonB C-terminal domain-containing protein [Roseateles sp. LKC17W]|uniref:TonB C-terminal domain-containing protein n=1 Tax=Pelomonas margarita TaxID=3299031 RepID=A0ABW7FQ84_9BURK